MNATYLGTDAADFGAAARAVDEALQAGDIDIAVSAFDDLMQAYRRMQRAKRLEPWMLDRAQLSLDFGNK